MLQQYNCTVTYNDVSIEVTTHKPLLSALRTHFNSNISNINKNDQFSVCSPTIIPWLYRAWVKWSDGRWVELINEQSFHFALNDSSFFSIPYNTNNNSNTPKPIHIIFANENHPSPNASSYIPSSVYHTNYKTALEIVEQSQNSLFCPSVPCLYDRLQCLIYDLLHFDGGEAHVYWDHIVTSSYPFPAVYLSSLYFCSEEQQLLYYFPTVNGSLFHTLVRHIMESKFSSKVSSASSHICSSHDLAPLYRTVFALDYPFYKREKFKKNYKLFSKWAEKRMKQCCTAATLSGSTSSSTSSSSTLVDSACTISSISSDPIASSSAQQNSEENKLITSLRSKLLLLNDEIANGSGNLKKTQQQKQELEKQLTRLLKTTKH